MKMVRALVALAVLVAPLGAQDRGAAALGPLVRGLGSTMRVLMIGAHPDDEDTQLLAWLARGQQVETAYLSLTRGDGGQNIIGNELGDALGAIRTEELLAARRLDGAKQYFTRAWDYGFSKNADEAFTQWNRDSLLRDVLTVVRAYRPHVIVSVFTGTPADGHGQHQAAGILAREAYERSQDSLIAPGETSGQRPWTVSKFYRGAFFRNQAQATIRMNVGAYDPVLGRTYAEIAAESRSQHRSQAMGTIQPRGVRYDQLLREAARVGPADARTERTIFDGLDTSWARFRSILRTPAQRAALARLPGAIAGAQRALNLSEPARLVGPLARVQALLRAACEDETECVPRDANSQLAADFLASLGTTRARLSSSLAHAAGVVAEASAEREIVAIGDSVRVNVALYNRGPLDLRVTERREAASSTSFNRVLAPDSVSRDVLVATGRDAGQPWWMTNGRSGPMFRTAASPLDEATRSVGTSVTYILTGAGASFQIMVPYTYRYADPVRGEITLPLVDAPAVTVTLDRTSLFARAGAPVDQIVAVTVRSHARATRDVDVRLMLPAGLASDSLMRRVRLVGWEGVNTPPGGNVPGSTQVVRFRVRGVLPPGDHQIRAQAASRGEAFERGYVPVIYDHIRPQRLYRPARVDVTAVDLVVPPGLSVGYIPGVSDDIVPALQELGVPVTVLDPEALGQQDLSGFTSLVVGPRAYEASPALQAASGRLLEYARSGGTLVVQYGQYEMTTPGIMPFPITLARPADRVTIENAPVTFVDSAHRVLTLPNRITSRDFDGWVQDRSLYMPRTFDAAYQAPLSVNDPGESPNRGAILVAPYGQGTYVYTTLAFFRQIPNGVPGSVRLFVNLLSARADRVTQ